MAFGKDTAQMALNGHSTVYFKPKAGTSQDVGYVAEVMAKAESINEETTFGDITVGFNLSVEGKNKQTGPDTWAAHLGALELDEVKIGGQAHDAVITGGLLATVGLQKGFNNKAGESFINFKALYPGASTTTAQGFIVAHS